MKPAILYRRVSTVRQADEGHSLESQQSAMTSWCAAREYSVVGDYEDAGRSGKTTKRRPGLEAAIELAAETRGTLVVYTLSRLARSTIDALKILERLRDAGAGLAVVDLGIDTATPIGELIFSIISAVVKFENELRGEAIRLANQHTVAKLGYRTQGAQPFGWRFNKDTGRRERVEHEQEVIKLVCRMYRSGWSTQAIADELNDTGTPTRENKRWHGVGIHNLLKRAGVKTRPHTGGWNRRTRESLHRE